MSIVRARGAHQSLSVNYEQVDAENWLITIHVAPDDPPPRHANVALQTDAEPAWTLVVPVEFRPVTSQLAPP